MAQNPATPNSNSMSTPAPKIENAIPILPVRDLARSITFYTETLGFKLDWGGPGDPVCGLSRDKRPIMLQQREKIDAPTWVWIGADESLFELFRAKGVKVYQEPKNYSWAYEMKFEDIDGNILWLGTDPKKDLPFEDRTKD